MIPENEIICGSALDVLRTLPKESISCCISSPPYWALRDYGVNGQLGLEKTFEEYIDKLCTIYDEVRRVLRKDGTCFVNLADTFSHGVCGGGSVFDSGRNDGRVSYETDKVRGREKKSTLSSNIPIKSLCLIPQRFAIEMVNRGWILRNVIIWHKPNPMPSSAKDRFTVDFEYVYFFVKSKKYYFEPQYEPLITAPHKPGWATSMSDRNDRQVDNEANLREWGNPLGRNKRTVWTIPTQAFPEAHFATYPEKLVEPMILSGCPEFICTECGKPRVKVYEKSGGTIGESWHDHSKDDIAGMTQGRDGLSLAGWKRQKETENQYQVNFKGYTDCGCGADFTGGIVLDCFCGSGTSLQVAARLNRNYLGIELNKEYIEMAEKRILQGESGISVKEQKAGQLALFKSEK